MTDINITFSRALLNNVRADVERAGMRVMKDAWVWHFHGDQWEFHGPDRFFWDGRADNAYEARYKGWCSWLRFKGVEGYAA